MTKKFETILLSGIATVCTAFGFAFSSVSSTNKAVADAPAYTATNVEDIVNNDTANVSFMRGSNSVAVTTNGTNFIYNADHPDMTTDVTTTGTVTNDYAGNINLNYATEGATGIYFNNGITQETVITYRTKYEKSIALSGFARSNKTAANGWMQAVSGYAYVFGIYNGKYTLAKFNNQTVDGVAQDVPVNGAKDEYNLVNYEAFTGTISDNDDVLITYGTQTVTGGVLCIFKMEKVNADNSTALVYENYYLDSDNPITTANAKNMYIVYGLNNADKTFILGGVDNVLFSDRNYTVTEEQTVGTVLSNVTLPSGYTWKDGTAAVEIGKNEYAATHTYEYYGETVEEDCTITVTGKVEYTATNVEDLINNNTANITFMRGGSSVAVTTSGTNFIYNADHPDMTTDVTTTGTVTNDYAGNISLNYATEGGTAIYFNEGITQESVISYRTKYEHAIALSGFARSNKTVSNGWMQAVSGYAYIFGIYNGRYTLAKCNNQSLPNAAQDVPVNGASDTYNLHTEVYNSNQANITNNTDVIITYGTKTVVSGVLCIFKIEKVNADNTTTLVYEHYFVDTDGVDADTTQAGGALENTYPAPITTANAKNMYIVYGLNDADKTFILGGVDNVLFSDRNYTVEGTVEPGTELSAYVKEGYTLTDTRTTVEEGVKAYSAQYSYTYFGKTVTEDCEITITAQYAGNTVTLLAEDGTSTVGTQFVNEGDAYVLPDDGTTGLMGWYVDGALYPIGYEITPVADMSIARVSLNFKVNAGASIRFATNNGKYGLTFYMELDKATYDAFVANGTITDLNGYICPVDKIGEVQSTGIVDIAADSMVEKDGKYTIAYSIATILNQNINRAFAGQAYIVVNYANGTTANIFADYVEADHARSVLEIAKATYARTQLDPTNPLYFATTADGIEVLESYINAAAEIVVYEENEVVKGDAIDEYETENSEEVDGYDVETTYVVESYTETVDAEDATKVNVTLVIDYENVELYTATDGTDVKIPVTLYIKQDDGTFKAVRIVTPTVVWNGKKVTLTFSYVK